MGAQKSLPSRQSAEQKKKKSKEGTTVRLTAEQELCFHSWVGCFKHPTVTSAAPSLNKSEIRGRSSQAWSALSPWLPLPIPVLLHRGVLLDLRHTAVEVLWNLDYLLTTAKMEAFKEGGGKKKLFIMHSFAQGPNIIIFVIYWIIMSLLEMLRPMSLATIQHFHLLDKLDVCLFFSE